ncbi:hypothetical protein [Ktedonospora formicarum]|uniref:ABC3 transporter permease protein domain-containing protein n=1 Tax=Ktedonospora formicarum TaxID=2778364 RepID=A0A8J3I8Z4_9CHLR|nr:hypothetical protein [Ktedonospora formicarum]GHO46869.1 hypothetical protein KSX_50320 [Ktedonospora formicarum]
MQLAIWFRPFTQSLRTTSSSVAHLTRWNWRSNWMLLFIICLGMSFAILLLCAIPLLEQVTGTASLRQSIRVSPENSRLTLSANAMALSPQLLKSMQATTIEPFRTHLAPYLKPEVQAQYRVGGFPLLTPTNPNAGDQLNFITTDNVQMRNHVHLIQGRFPTNNAGSELEVALKPQVAQALNISLGSTITTNITFFTSPTEKDLAGFTRDPHLVHNTELTMRVVGLIDVNANDIFWRGTNFLPTRINPERAQPVSFPLLLSSNALALWCQDRLEHENIPTIKSEIYQGPLTREAFVFDKVIFASWDLFIDPSHLTIEQYNQFRQDLRDAGTGFSKASTPQDNNFLNFDPPYLAGQAFGSPILGDGPSILNQLSTHLALSHVPVLIISLPTILLDLFFMSFLISLLVERQSGTIAILRSRGASSLQIMLSFTFQGLIAALLAVAIGTICAPLVVSSVTRTLLQPLGRDAVDVLWSNPWHTILSTSPYMLVAFLAGMGILILTLIQSLRLNILTLRKETARATRRPFWERFYLDIFATLIAICLYLLANYAYSLRTLLSDDVLFVIATPLALLAPFFLILGLAFCFLRLAPRVLNFLASLASRGRAAPLMLALAQMTRSPQRPLQVSLLLALASSFIMLTLIFSNSQQLRLTELARYENIADFSGTISDNSISSVPNAYHSLGTLKGVKAASVGNQIVGFIDQSHATRIRAIDSSTYAQATFWSNRNAEQPLSELMRTLVAKRDMAIQQHVVPALIDALGWDELHLSPGKTFTLTSYASGKSYKTTFFAVARVNEIEGMYDSPQLKTSNDLSVTPALLVDYQTLATYRAQTDKQPMTLTQFWLRTSDDPALLTQLRSQLSASALHITELKDRRALLDTLRTDP